MKKICYVLPSFYPSGGNKIAIEHLSRLADRGADCYISVVSDHKDGVKDWFDLSKVKEIDFKKEELNKMDVVTATYYETVFRIEELKLDNPELFYFVQSTEWDFFETEQDKMRVKMTFYKPQFKIITEARWIQREIRQNFGRQTHYVPNHLELPIIDVPPTTGKKQIVLIEGNCESAKKGIYLAVEAFKYAKEEYEFWLLTNSKEENIPRGFISLFDKKFCGVPWEEALKVIGQANIFVKPSLLEGQSGPIMEAMAFGKPIVCFDIPSAYEMCIDEYNCLMVSVGNIYKLKQAVDRIVNDGDLHQRLIDNSFETSLTFNQWNKSIDKLVDIYEIY